MIKLGRGRRGMRPHVGPVFNRRASGARAAHCNRGETFPACAWGRTDSRKTSDRGPRAGSANQPFDERIRDRGVGHRFDSLYVEYPQADESNDITLANPRKTARHRPTWRHLRIRSPQADSLIHMPAPQRVARKRISVIGDGAAEISAMGEFGTSAST